MAEVRNLGDAFAWPITRLADCFGVHRQTLTRRIKDAGLAPAGEYRGNPTYHIAQVAQVMYSAEERGSHDPDDMTPQDRKAWFESEVKRRDIQKMDRELIPVAEVERVVSTAFAAIASDMRALPDNLERRHGLSGEVVERIEEGIFLAMDALADRLATLGVTDDEE